MIQINIANIFRVLLWEYISRNKAYEELNLLVSYYNMKLIEMKFLEKEVISLM